MGDKGKGSGLSQTRVRAGRLSGSPQGRATRQGLAGSGIGLNDEQRQRRENVLNNLLNAERARYEQALRQAQQAQQAQQGQRRRRRRKDEDQLTLA